MDYYGLRSCRSHPTTVHLDTDEEESGFLVLVTKQAGQLRALECCPTCTQLTHLFHDKPLPHTVEFLTAGRPTNKQEQAERQCLRARCAAT